MEKTKNLYMKIGNDIKEKIYNNLSQIFLLIRCQNSWRTYMNYVDAFLCMITVWNLYINCCWDILCQAYTNV